MKSILVAYATAPKGQTRKIAQFIVERIKAAGYEVDLLDTTSTEAASVSPIYVAGVFASGETPIEFCAFHQGQQALVKGDSDSLVLG